MMDTPEIPTASPQQQLVDLINHDNKKNFALNDITLSVPIAVTYEGRNTKITVTANLGSKYFGSQDFYYNRLALNDLGYLGVLSETPLSMTDMLSMMSTQKRVDLWPDEFEPFTVPVLEEGEVGKIILRAKPAAIKWRGEVQVEYLFKLPDNVNALHQFLHYTLPSAGYLL
jgi:hypothetical protein